MKCSCENLKENVYNYIVVKYMTESRRINKWKHQKWRGITQVGLCG